MRILVIEDEALVALSLIRILKELVPDAIIEGPLESVSASKSWFQLHVHPDLILSDIQLSDGISMDIFHQHSITCPIIFTTAYDEYAIRAFKLNSIDYLLKPIDKKELEGALQKFYSLQSKYTNYEYLSQMKGFLSVLNQTPIKQYKVRFTANVGRSVTMIPISEIAFFLKEELVYIINKEGKRFMTDHRSLDEVQELLDPALFYRANRQHLIHMPFIERYRVDDTFKVTITLRSIKSAEIIVSKDKAADFKKWFD